VASQEGLFSKDFLNRILCNPLHRNTSYRGGYSEQSCLYKEPSLDAKKAKYVVTRHLRHCRRCLLKTFRQRCETLLLIQCHKMEWFCVCPCSRKRQNVCCCCNIWVCLKSLLCSHNGHKSEICSNNF
jgi:hypothetical protein